jgi:sulfur relay (sulfurtransferase) DsrC/TusE family protein
LAPQGFTLFPETDMEGFLIQPETWTKAVAELLAQGDVPGKLTEEHWKVLDCLRILPSVQQCTTDQNVMQKNRNSWRMPWST